LFLDAGRFCVFASPTVNLKPISFLERSFAGEREREREGERVGTQKIIRV